MPVRTCIGCRKTDEQARLVRLVVDANGRVRVDRKRRLAGRGAWVHPILACVEEMVQTSGLPKSFRRRTQPTESKRLWAEIEEEGLEHE